MALKESEKPMLCEQSTPCPLRGDWVSFQLVDERGSGKPYAGLPYVLIDSVNQQHVGVLDGDGYAKVYDHYEGPVILQINSDYTGSEQLYSRLIARENYPLPIKEIQVRAENTRFVRKDGTRVDNNPAQKNADQFFQVEVRNFVEHATHLPPRSLCKYPPNYSLLKAMGDIGFDPEASTLWGVALQPNKRTVMEVRPLRAFRPMLSKDNAFSALNLYQLALMATFSYSDFGQQPEKPEDTVSFPLDPSVGFMFGNGLASFQETWKIDKAQTVPYYPLYEDVPYSKRFEILPFDPLLYKQNKIGLGEKQDHPAKLHFFDDAKAKDGTNTQAFITHHDEIILISVRGTAEIPDFLRDADAEQVPFAEGVGTAHKGFYNAYKAMSAFVTRYLSQFYSGQKVVICGHSLGGAIATLLAEALRRDATQKYDILLYTYGSPRAGDQVFVKGAADLVHHRMVNNNDPIPSLPAPWMNTRTSVWVPGLILSFVTLPYVGMLIFAAGLAKFGDADYEHHGALQHFMPVHFKGRDQSAVLWSPGCDSIEEAACSIALKKQGDLPDRDNFIKQLFQFSNHKMVDSYIPNAWATLRRWQQTQDTGTTIITKTEYDQVSNQLLDMQTRLKEKRSELTYGLSGLEHQDRQRTISALDSEVRKLDESRQRLNTLFHRTLTPMDVYGSAIQSPELSSGIERWLTKKENKVEVQLAMIPQQSATELRMA
ncbi:lipase family protein [Pseudomonas purpurea]|uniref:lipase family protein n=1 Tax=Pseudomonas purpurea TaxID=3136737 RepID=UPI003265157E